MGGFSDPNVNFITYEIIKPPNFPPYFTGEVQKDISINLSTLKANQVVTYTIPSYTDPNWEEVTLTVAHLRDFMHFDGIDTIQFKGMNEKNLGSYIFDLILTDERGMQKIEEVKLNITNK